MKSEVDKKALDAIARAEKAWVEATNPKVKEFFKANLDLAKKLSIQWPAMTMVRNEPSPDKNHPDNMKHLITQILKLKPRLNLLKKEIYLDDKAFDDFDLGSLSLRAIEHGLNGNDLFIKKVLREIGQANAYHPFKAAVESKPWDGIDRITQLSNTLIIHPDHAENTEFYHEYVKRWTVGVIAKVYKPGSQNMVLVLQSPEQGIGKTTFFHRFKLSEGTFLEGAVNPSNKDHKMKHLDFVIWSISELDGSTKKSDSAALKDFFTLSEVVDRRAYGHFDTAGKSQLSFCASVNETCFLPDNTGNRRYLIIPVVAIDQTPIDMQQVFAQALELYRSGFQYWFNSEENERISTINLEYSVQNKVDHLASRISRGDDWVSGQAIFEMFDPNFKYLPSDLQKLGHLLKRKGIKSERRVVNGLRQTLYGIKRPGFAQP